jgi:hypothetical protein
MTIITSLVVVVFGGIYVAADQNKQFGLLVGRTFADWQYPVVRLVRLTTLPLHGYFNLSTMYKWECILQNPTYVPSKTNHLLTLMTMF